jgi:hypothetical protein
MTRYTRDSLHELGLKIFTDLYPYQREAFINSLSLIKRDDLEGNNPFESFSTFKKYMWEYGYFSCEDGVILLLAAIRSKKCGLYRLTNWLKKFQNDEFGTV